VVQGSGIGVFEGDLHAYSERHLLQVACDGVVAVTGEFLASGSFTVKNFAFGMNVRVVHACIVPFGFLPGELLHTFVSKSSWRSACKFGREGM
jgi:hypothetical protein